MKTAAAQRTNFKMHAGLPYPNAATRKEMFNKILDLLLVVAIGAGLAASCLLLLVIS